MQNYSFFQKKLHHLILGNKIINKSLFEIEKILFAKKLNNFQNHKHVFITGLPRSGTTALLEFLFKTKKYASLTYKDMPFILSPNLFSKLTRFQEIKLKERIHKDGIMYNLDSPEAFDDIFFQNFSAEEIKDNLIIYISLVLKKYNKELYLSKNNNNYKRIRVIQSILPNTKFIIPFRNPLQHANSLFIQHQHFCLIQKKDKFILDYMNYLGHFEFGLNHKHWHKSRKYSDSLTLNYWLEQWLLFYKNILKDFSSSPEVLFVSYEKVSSSKSIQNKLLQKLKLRSNQDFKFHLSKKNVEKNYDKKLLNQCILIHGKLLDLTEK